MEIPYGTICRYSSSHVVFVDGTMIPILPLQPYIVFPFFRVLPKRHQHFKIDSMDNPVKKIEFKSKIVPPVDMREPAWWFAFQENKLLIMPDSTSASIPLLRDVSELGFPVLSQNYLGLFDGRHCYAVEAPGDVAPPAGMVFEGLRQVFGRLEEDVFWVAARAVQIVDWDRMHQFCGRCGVR
ncbi:MAG: hypothetical protein EHM36_08945, partial [Deltaproteobacteria bacterium]